MIPDDAVEAAARWLWAREGVGDEWDRPSWDEIESLDNPAWRAIQRDALQDACELLEAAAPYMLSDTKAEAIPNPYHPLGEGVHRVTGIRRSAVTNRYITE